MNKKELGRKLRTYAKVKSRTYRDFTKQENRTDEMAERLKVISDADFDALDKLIIQHGEALAEERFTTDIIATKLEEMLTKLINKYANKEENEISVSKVHSKH